MERLKFLENQKLISRLNYSQIEYEHQQEILNRIDDQFNESVFKLLEEYPDVKNIYQSKVVETNQNIKQIIQNDTENNDESTEDSNSQEPILSNTEEVVQNKRDIKLKKLYREIAKITHPDKIKNDGLNALYILATDKYNSGDLVELLLIAGKFGISFDLDNEDIVEISDKISFYDSRIKIMKSSYAWIWHSTEDDLEKRKILLRYINNRIES